MSNTLSNTLSPSSISIHSRATLGTLVQKLNDATVGNKDGIVGNEDKPAGSPAGRWTPPATSLKRTSTSKACCSTPSSVSTADEHCGWAGEAHGGCVAAAIAQQPFDDVDVDGLGHLGVEARLPRLFPVGGAAVA
jgi:hypothetical protein